MTCSLECEEYSTGVEKINKVVNCRNIEAN